MICQIGQGPCYSRAFALLAGCSSSPLPLEPWLALLFGCYWPCAGSAAESKWGIYWTYGACTRARLWPSTLCLFLRSTSRALFSQSKPFVPDVLPGRWMGRSRHRERYGSFMNRHICCPPIDEQKQPNVGSHWPQISSAKGAHRVGGRVTPCKPSHRRR